VLARGRTYSGSPFTREQTVTAVAIAGGDRPVPDPAPQGGDLERWCDLLRCLTGKDVLGERLMRSLMDLGVNFEALHACLERLCRPEHQPVKETVPEKENARFDADLLARLLVLANQDWAVDPGAGIATLVLPEPWTPEPTEHPGHDHDHGEPMFDLSPEDKAAGGHDEQTDRAPLTGPPAEHPGRPVNGEHSGLLLSPEDRAAGGHDRQDPADEPDKE